MKQLFERSVSGLGPRPRVFALAFNYSEEPPATLPEMAIFTKNVSGIPCEPKQVDFSHRWDIYTEVELGLMISQQCKGIRAQEWRKYIGGYFLLIDFTAVPPPEENYPGNYPWFLKKSFDNSLVVSRFIEPEEIPEPHNVGLELALEEGIVHKGNTRHLLNKIPEQLAEVSKYLTLDKGDFICTGTPPKNTKVGEKNHLKARLSVEGKQIASLDFGIRFNRK